MSLRLLVILLATLSLGAVSTRPHLLAWETQAQAVTFTVDQCANLRPRKGGCVFETVATLPGTTRQWATAALPRHISFCWRVRPVGPPVPYPWSNIVCT